MGREANIDSIRALDERIIKLKRTRNSLLNISARMPPEILGCIFAWSLSRQPSRSLYSPHFNGLPRGSYNFLLVCYHWFEVASRTPELWTFWGSTLQDWKKQQHRSGVAPLELVLDESEIDPGVHFDESLHSAIRTRVMQDAIRQVHLRSDDDEIMTSIIFALTPGDEDAQNANIESIVWENGGVPAVDISNFFARSHLTRLRLLHLFGSFRISSWDCLASRTTHLIGLSLQIDESPQSPIPTTSQLFSILSSNPSLRQLVLSNAALPNDTYGSTLEMPLPNLKLLSLTGEFRPLLGLLRRLILPATLDTMDLTLFEPTMEDISRTLGPYLRDHFRHDVRVPGGLVVSSSFASSSIVTSVDTISTLPTIPASVTVTAVLPIPHAVEQLLINLIALIPGEYIVSFIAHSVSKLPEEAFFMMPNIEALHLSKVELSEGFLQPNPDGPHANAKLLPSLESLCLEDITLNDDNWGHLTTYLVHQTSDNQVVSLKVTGSSPYIPPSVVNEIRELVGEFTITVPGSSNQ